MEKKITVLMNKFDNQARQYKCFGAVEITEEKATAILRNIPPMVEEFYSYKFTYRGEEVVLKTTRSIDELLHYAEPQPA